MYATQDDQQLGIAPAIVAVAVPTVSKLAKSIFGGTSAQRDKKRFKEIDALYAKAVGGNSAALSRLKAAGWATAPAKKYSTQKYQAAVAALASKGFSVSDQTGTMVPQTGTYTPPVAQASMLGGIPAPVLVGGGVLALILFLRRK